MLRITPNNIQTLDDDQVFVFGSNAEGKHYGGAARLANEKFGAIMGQSFGLQGKSFGINSMSGWVDLGLDILKFNLFALDNKHLDFLVTEIGCGIAGYEPKDVAPFFKNCLDMENVYLPQRFIDELTKSPCQDH